MCFCVDFHALSASQVPAVVEQMLWERVVMQQGSGHVESVQRSLEDHPAALLQGRIPITPDADPDSAVDSTSSFFFVLTDAVNGNARDGERSSRTQDPVHLAHFCRCHSMLKARLSKGVLEAVQHVVREHELVGTPQPGPDEVQPEPRS